MKRVSNTEFRRHFIGWQCRIRQIAMRDYDGRPLAAMMPRVSNRKGEVAVPAMIVLLLHDRPEDVTSYFRFLVQKSNDPQTIREAGLKFLAAEYYQVPELFSDQMAAVFLADSAIARRLERLKTVLLDFEQFGQSYRMFCTAKKLAGGDGAREAALWHNRLFNPNLPNDAAVLAFAPDWKTAQAEPMPG